MYTALLVEDDPVALRGLQRNIPWAELGIETVMSAGSGEEGLQRATERMPDILIVDIRLPGIDGVEMASRLREQDSRAQVILVTAHKDFAYAQRAIPIGVVDFILKPVQKNKLFAAIATACEELQQIDDTRDAEATARRIIRYDLVRRALKGTVRFSDITQSRDLQSISGAKSVVISIRLGSTNVAVPTDTSVAGAIVADIEQTFCSYEQCIVTVTDMTFREIGLIVSAFQKANGAAHMLAREVGDEIVKAVRTRHGLRVAVGIGRMVEHVQDLSHSYQRAKQAAEFCDIYGGDGAVAYADIVKTSLCAPRGTDEVVDKLLYSIAEGDESATRTLLQNELSKFEPGALRSNRKTLGVAFARIARVLEEAGIIDNEQAHDWEYAEGFWLMTENVHGFEELTTKAVEFVGELCLYCRGSLMSDAQLLARRAALVICQSYSDKNLSLGMVAREVGACESRLSSIFKREQGLGLNHFVRRIRMNNAAELLKGTSIPISDIANQVGYDNSHYFATCFRKEMGFRPSDLRKVSAAE